MTAARTVLAAGPDYTLLGPGEDAVQIRILPLQNLVQPMRQLDVGIAAHFAEDSGALHRFIT